MAKKHKRYMKHKKTKVKKHKRKLQKNNVSAKKELEIVKNALVDIKAQEDNIKTLVEKELDLVKGRSLKDKRRLYGKRRHQRRIRKRRYII